MRKSSRVIALIVLLFSSFVVSSRADAQVITQEWLCDSSAQDCRQTLINLIRAETVGIDFGFWFMEDSRYVDELIARWQAGVPVRVLIDTKANSGYPLNATMISALANAGIPIRRVSSRYLHWKVAIFAGQNVAQFGSANYSPSAFVPREPLVDFQDETIFFTNDPALVNSFKTRFDDNWISTSAFTNYANVSGTLVRSYPVYPTASDLNFPPSQHFTTRSVARYNAETAPTGGIDIIQYRMTDDAFTDAVIAAHQRGVPVRVLVEQREYRVTSRARHSYNVDRLIAAGIPVKQRRHAGWNHEKLALLHGQRMTIFGSQNWSFTAGQYEHNYFTTKAWIYDWFTQQFERKWNSSTEHEPFVPLPPGAPVYSEPASGASIVSDQVTLRWNGGLWAHKYDIYLGTNPSNLPLVAADVFLGNSDNASDLKSHTVTGLTQGVTYYWRVVSKTMANLSANGTVWNFRTGAPPTPSTGDVVMWAAHAPTIQGLWTLTPDSAAAGGSRLGTANAGVKVSTALASPADFFEMTFTADAGVPYRLWMRGKAVSNNWANDSAFAQFSDSVTSTGAPTWRIGTTSATTVTIEDCTSCGLAAWGWNDNLTNGTAGALGTPVYFAAPGAHTIRVQKREDGLSIDQIVLSRDTFLNTSPGTTKNDGTILPEQGGSSGSGGGGGGDDPSLPDGWQSVDVGLVGNNGSANETNGTFTVHGGGADVWGTTDAFHYAYRTLPADGTITARVAQLIGSQSWTKIGVMIRGSLAPDAAHGFMVVSRTKGLAFQYRPADGGASLSISGGTGTAPRWVRLTRAGNVVTAFVSTDGVNWTTVGSDTIALPATAFVGLVAHSHTTSELATGVFDSVSVVP